MYSPLVHKRIERLGIAINDVKSCENDMMEASDPALIQELREELIELLKELDDVGEDCIIILEAYVEDCKEQNIPYYLDYVRVLKELRKASILNARDKK